MPTTEAQQFAACPAWTWERGMTVEGRAGVAHGSGFVRGVLLGTLEADRLHVITSDGRQVAVLQETATPYLVDGVTRSSLTTVLRLAWKCEAYTAYDARTGGWVCHVGSQTFRDAREVRAILLALQACGAPRRAHWMNDGRLYGHAVPGPGPDVDVAKGDGVVRVGDPPASPGATALADAPVSGQSGASSVEAPEARRAALIEECNTIRERLASVYDLSWSQIHCLGRIDAWINQGAVEDTFHHAVREHHIRSTFKALIRRGLIVYKPVRLTDYGRKVATDIRRMEEIRAMKPADLRPEMAS